MVDFDVAPVDEDAVLREVWNTDQVDAKTELTALQVESVNKLITLSSLFDNELINSHVNEFMVLQKSLDRQSMKEFIEGIRAKRDDFVGKGKGFFSSMLG